MRERKTRVHLEATKKTSSTFAVAVCGWLDVQATADLSQVTCKACLRLGRPKRARAAQDDAPLSAALTPLLAPTAGPPPRVTSELWRDSCRGAEHRRCGRCELCEWERVADRMAAQSPWNERPGPRRPPGSPTWPSLKAALLALADFEQHDRFAPSAMGPMLDRVKTGNLGDGGRSRPEDPLLQRAGELVTVRQALERAYPEGTHPLPASVRMRLLLERTPGVCTPMPTYEQLAQREHVAVGELRALVRTGRQRVALDLAERGLIPAKELARTARAVAGWR